MRSEASEKQSDSPSQGHRRGRAAAPAREAAEHAFTLARGRTARLRPAIAVLATSATARPPIAQERAPSLQKDVDSLVRAGVPGAILLVRDGKRKVRSASGSRISTRQAMRAADHFKIASLTKSYTATVVLQLVGEGKLRLNQSVEHWLPGSSRTAMASRSTTCSSTPAASSTSRPTSGSSSRISRGTSATTGPRSSSCRWPSRTSRSSRRARPRFYSNTNYVLSG